jgi:cytosine/adenosine deaminase-related metal-dependent hydrolase
MTSLWLRNVLLPHGAHADLCLAQGRIRWITAPGALTAEQDDEEEDLAGALLLPGLVEGHVHLDKVLLGLPWMPHVEGESVPERIEAEKRLRAGLSVPIGERAALLLEWVIAAGSTQIRSHVDIDDEIGLSGVEALLEVRERWRDRVDIQLVAFPQSGIIRQTRVAELMDEALRLGVEVVGGLDPAGYDASVDGHLEVVFRLAERHGCAIDLHLHDMGELGAFQLRQIAERSIAGGLQGKVAASHAFALGCIETATFDRTAEALAGGGVAIMTSAPGPVPMPPIKRLAEAGVLVFAGSDNIRDSWSPLGNGDALDRARLIAWRQGFGSDADLWTAFDMITHTAARALALEDYGIHEGGRADLVGVRARHVPQAVAECPPRALVVKRGRVVARNGRLC